MFMLPFERCVLYDGLAIRRLVYNEVALWASLGCVNWHDDLSIYLYAAGF
jgi:hypothetical protein